MDRAGELRRVQRFGKDAMGNEINEKIAAPSPG